MLSLVNINWVTIHKRQWKRLKKKITRTPSDGSIYSHACTICPSRSLIIRANSYISYTFNSAFYEREGPLISSKEPLPLSSYCRHIGQVGSLNASHRYTIYSKRGSMLARSRCVDQGRCSMY